MKENDASLTEVILPDGNTIRTQKGTSLLELSKRFEHSYRSTIIAARVNHDIKELSFCLEDPCSVEFIDLSQDDGMRIYRRSLFFILIRAVYDLYPDRKVVLGHSISKGMYFEVRGKQALTEPEVEAIEQQMHKLVLQKIPFVKRELSLEDARSLFAENGRMDRVEVIEHREKPYVTVYGCGDLEDYFYGYMAPDTGYIQKFELKYYAPGLILRFPEKKYPDILPAFQEQKKLFTILNEFKRWGNILGVGNVGTLNDLVKSGKICDMMRVSEALHEKKIAQIADMITESGHQKRLVLIAGPSSSGKTTFANRLAIQLRVNGLKPITISLDDYFVDRDNTPRDEMGDFDYEALEAIDIKLFNEHLSELICGREVEIPVFNFPNGCRNPIGRNLCIRDDQVMIIEGIHGLNERLTSTIPRDSKFKIYVSALTSLNIDDHNRIPSTDTRLIRRIVRDFQFRGTTAVSTIKRWPSVRRGEEKNIFPFQEEADIMFNSFLVYELGVLKTLAERQLSEVDATHPEYSEARRLIEFLSYFLPIDAKEVPMNSIIREFYGGSCFYG
jgi:uridine kinase